MRGWTTAELFSLIRSHPASIDQRLRELQAGGLVVEEPGDAPTFRFAPAHDDWIAQVAAVREAYQQRPIKVIELIFSQPSDQLRAFANAFRIKTDPPPSHG